MKKILQVLDIEGWAIDTLARAVADYNPQYEWKRVFLHPKDLEQNKLDLEPVRQAILWADVIDAQYWRTISQLLDRLPELKDKKIVLTHHNEKNLLSYEWPENITHIAKTKFSENELETKYPSHKIHYIANSFDHKKFSWNENYPPAEPMVGYVGRIAPWKGLKDVAKACYEIKVPLMIMGKHDKMSYWNEIPKEHQDNIRWDFFNCEDKDRADFYKEITVYVGNSGSGREVGTLGFIEALASGVPVVTTPSGLAKDIAEHEENMLVVDYDDYDQLKDSIKQVLESQALQQKLRKGGWETIRNYNDYRMAMEYRKVFNKLMFGGDLVSVIIPSTKERAEYIKRILLALESQSYDSIEAVIAWDGTKTRAEEAQLMNEVSAKFPVKHVFTRQSGYNLAMARNMAVVEADGKYLMFCDSRMLPASNAVEVFIQKLKEAPDEKSWLFGEKGGNKVNFVENFSFIEREKFIKAGMCLERITGYGAMSQELRMRFASQGFSFGYVKDAIAEPMVGSKQNTERRQQLIGSKNLLYKLGY